MPKQYSNKSVFLISFVVVIAVIGIVVLLLIPMIDKSCEITIKSLVVAKDGQVTLEYATRHPSGVFLRLDYLEDGKYRAGSRGGGFPPLRVKGGGTTGFSVRTDFSKAIEIVTESQIKERIFLEEGQTYRLKAGERLQIYKVNRNDGVVCEGYFEIE